MTNKNKILIVDDEEDVTRSLLRAFLKRDISTYEPVIALDGYEALNSLERDDIEAVVLDIEMANLNGMDVCRELAYRRNINKDRIIISSGFLDDERRDLLRSWGYQRFLDKPYTFDDLFKLIDSILLNKTKGQ